MLSCLTDSFDWQTKTGWATVTLHKCNKLLGNAISFKNISYFQIAAADYCDSIYCFSHLCKHHFISGLQAVQRCCPAGLTHLTDRQRQDEPVWHYTNATNHLEVQFLLEIYHIFKLPLPMMASVYNVFMPFVNVTLFQVYKSFSDAVLLDWFISLTDKDRMSHCDVTYFKLKGDSDDVIPAKENSDDVITAKENSDDVMVVSSFMPTSRTFVLKPLEANQGPML